MSKKKILITKIPIEKIEVDLDVHPRERLNKEAATEYGVAMSAGKKLPPIIVFQEGKIYFLADGWHRLEGAKNCFMKEIEAVVYKGSRRDAILFAVRANNEHGLQRTNADKRKAVRIVLKDKEWRKRSVNEIAQLCNVSWNLANNVHRTHLRENEDSGKREVQRGGKTYEQEIGKRGEEKKPVTRVNRVVQAMDAIDKARLGWADDQSVEKSLRGMMDRLHKIARKATGAADRITNGLRVPLNVYSYSKESSLRESGSFKGEGYATHAVEVGYRCGHQCVYCSVPATHRKEEVFTDIGLTAYNRRYAIVDPEAHLHMDGLEELQPEDIVLISGLSDAWSPEAQKYGLGPKCLAKLLEESKAQVQILTKNAAVRGVFGLIKKHRDRVTVGMSITGLAEHEPVLSLIEPNASPVSERIKVMNEAHRRGLRTLAVFGPILPGLFRDADHLTKLLKLACKWDAEQIWVEPVNARGQSLVNCEEDLEAAGFETEAEAVGKIREKAIWTVYAADLVRDVQKAAKDLDLMKKLNILLFKSNFRNHPDMLDRINENPKGIVWKDSEDESEENMYAGAKTWSPFKGCKFDCNYCEPSFKRQAKRQKNLCQDCYSYTPHRHEERLPIRKIPSAPIIFVCGNSDISFCRPDFTRRIIESIVEHSASRPQTTYYLQSKKPDYFKPFLSELPESVVLLTTLETNRDKGYKAISKAPPPSVRYKQFKALAYPRKVVTVEPVLDFDLRTFGAWIRGIQPEHIWLGFNSKPESVDLPEPSEEKVQKLANKLLDAGIEVRGKKLRGVVLPTGTA
jgi:DNA repair photolyase